MAIKQMMFSMVFFVSTNSFATLTVPNPPSSLRDEVNQNDFVFYKGIITIIEGNDLWSYLNFERLQETPTPVFKDTKIVEFTNDNEFQEVGTLGSFEKAGRDRTREVETIRSVAIPRGTVKSHKSPNKPAVVAKFEKHAAMNNAIYCRNVDQVADYDGNLHYVGAIIYRTQKLERCAFYKEYLAQQKLATKK